MLIIIVMSNRNIIIIAGGTLIILMFVMFMMGENNRGAQVSQIMRGQEGVNQMVPQEESKERNVLLSAQGISNESGIATLTETNGTVAVNLYLTGYVSNVAQPAHIHAGLCPGVGAIRYPLNPVVNGKSTTILNVTLMQLKQSPLAINVHKSNTDISTYTSCGSL